MEHLLQFYLLGHGAGIRHGAEVILVVDGTARTYGKAGDAGSEAVAKAGGEGEVGCGG